MLSVAIMNAYFNEEKAAVEIIFLSTGISQTLCLKRDKRKEGDVKKLD